MKIRHLNCGTMRPYGIPRQDGTGGFFARGDGLVLVETGWGMRDYTDPAPTVSQFMYIGGCTRDPEETAVRQAARLGFKPADVRHIFLTHMHLDHAGGLPDFPAAEIHLAADELDACLHPRTYMERFAYRPEHWAHGPRRQPHPLQGGRWFEFDCAAPVRIGGVEFVMVPFTGHTRGHCAVAVRTGGGWLLHCGDIYGYQPQVDPVQPYKYPCGSLMETVITTGFNMPRRHWISMRNFLREHGDEVRAFCSHAPW